MPVEDVAGTVKDLVQAGKVRHFGLSEMSPATHTPGCGSLGCSTHEIVLISVRLTERGEVAERLKAAVC